MAYAKQEFDKEQDKNLAEEKFTTENGVLTISVMQYKAGAKKIQISRQTKRGEELMFAKLGRLNKEEAEAVKEALNKLIDKM